MAFQRNLRIRLSSRIGFLIVASLLCRTVVVRADATSDRICRQLAESPKDRDLLDMLKAIIPKAQPEEQGRLTVIYSLGLRYAGESAAADSMKAFAVRRHPDCVYLPYLGSKYTSLVCTSCRGSGKVSGACATCNGSGKCPGCGGSGGKMIAGLNGSRKLFPCAKCRRSGQCAECAGSGRTSGVCSRCRGSGRIDSSGKIERVFVAMLKGDDAALKGAAMGNAYSGGSPSTGTVSTPEPVDNREARAEMDEYMRTMKDLARQHGLKMAVRADMKRVVGDAAFYKGKLLKSRGFLHQASYRRVLIAPASASSLANAVEFIPQSREVGEAVMAVSKEMGGKGNVMVTFGVVNEQNLTLFTMEKL